MFGSLSLSLSLRMCAHRSPIFALFLLRSFFSSTSGAQLAQSHLFIERLNFSHGSVGCFASFDFYSHEKRFFKLFLSLSPQNILIWLRPTTSPTIFTKHNSICARVPSHKSVHQINATTTTNDSPHSDGHGDPTRIRFGVRTGLS